MFRLCVFVAPCTEFSDYEHRIQNRVVSTGAGAVRFETLVAQLKPDLNPKIPLILLPFQYVFGNIQTKFWDCDPVESFELSNNVGLRNHYICSVYAARLMVPRKSGLIVTISSYGGFGYLFDVAYGISKAGCDRLASDAAVDLHESGVVSVSLWPGAVKTEAIRKQVLDKPGDNVSAFSRMQVNFTGTFEPIKNIFEQGETVEYSGKCIIALATDPDRTQFNGSILTTSDVGRKYKIFDEGNAQPLEIPDAFKKYLNLVNDYRKPPYSVLKF